MGVDVHLQNVCRVYRTGSAESITALDGIDAEIAAGSVGAIAGPSGSGKSTLLHLVGAMDSVDEGTIRVGDRIVTSLSRAEQADYRRTIGFVFQRFHLLPALTVLDNVVAPLIPYRVGFDKFARGRELLEAVSLGDRGKSLPSKLSGGEQQRVAIARALINQPGLLLADEPTGNLDSDTSVEIMELLLTLRDEHGMTIIVASHDPLIATRCERMLRLSDGRIVEDLRLSELGGVDEVLDRINRPGSGA